MTGPDLILRAMRDLGIWLPMTMIFCVMDPAASLVPPFTSGRTRSSTTITCSTYSIGTYPPRGASRASTRLSSLEALERQEGHMLPEDPGATAGMGNERKSANRSRWSKGQVSWSTSSRKTEGESAATNELEGGKGLGVGQAMGAETQKVRVEVGLEGPAGAEEDGVAADMGPAERHEGDPAAEMASKSNVTKKRLKKYFLKDYEDSSWTVGIQWKNQPYRIQTTKVALKADGSVIWLDKGKGTWRLRTKSRDLVFYRDYFLNWNGKRIYSAKLVTNTCDMYLEGQIKGWTPLKSLEVMGTFQAVRRGIVVDENTPRPPWEDRPAPQVPETEKRRFPRNREVVADVDLS